MNVLVVGGGGREHALAWKASLSPRVSHVFVAPGNAGTELEKNISNVNIQVESLDELLSFAQDNAIELTIVGPEVPLVMGIVDKFSAAGKRCFGPDQFSAQLEGSKTFSKDFLSRHNIPTAAYKSFTQTSPAIEYVKQQGAPIVIKADGLAAGKGVIIAQTIEEANRAIEDMLAGNAFGEAGNRVVVEEFLHGEEASFIVICDGKSALPMATSQDHKARDNGDLGPNTGGMGAYSPAPVVTPEVHDKIMTQVINPTIKGMADEGHPYTGFLYAGVMIDQEGTPKVLEFNCRFGDPETQPIMMRLQSDLTEMLDAALDKRLSEITTQWDTRASLGVVLAAKGYPEKYSKGHRIHGLPTEPSTDHKVFHAGTVRSDDGIVTHGGRVLCAVGMGSSVNEAQKTAYALAANIQWDGVFSRTDIGYRAIARENR